MDCCRGRHRSNTGVRSLTSHPLSPRCHEGHTPVTRVHVSLQPWDVGAIWNEPVDDELHSSGVLPPVVCLCSEVMLELALGSAVTHLQLRQRKHSSHSARCVGANARLWSVGVGESADCLSDLSASRARWRWADCVAACCYNTHFISSFSLRLLFCFCFSAARMVRGWERAWLSENVFVWGSF